MHSILSPCADELMTPNNILNMAMLKELDFVSITDHNTTKQLKVIKELENSYMLKEKGLVAFIGKKLVETATGDTVFLTDAAQHWFTEDHIKWKKEKRLW